MRIELSGLKHLLLVPPLNPAALGSEFHHEFWRGTHIQIVTQRNRRNNFSHLGFLIYKADIMKNLPYIVVKIK